MFWLSFRVFSSHAGKRNLDKILQYTNGLLYGSDELGTRATLQLYADAKSLWSRYACFDNSGFYYSMSQCEAFNDKILGTTGLLGAVQDYSNLVRDNLKWASDNLDSSRDLNSGAPLRMQQYGEYGSGAL